ncbi:ZIP zinc/iron transport family [Xylaria bambusicola]|uniref:ZIP zinc/iron transport family n=1 Tax=Xylaria bambusicola TaxID=326684 RepID=UPI002007A5CB|nr:ZIP zinc/iron transport family [Xylaria bambusicola]KAI0512715.1 ZIP zinc/iron transport family [Xylaria bambusicola]
MSFSSAAMDAVLQLRQAEAEADSEGRTVIVQCGTGNEYDGRNGLRISSIFVIFIGSLLGAYLPILFAKYTKLKAIDKMFFIAKYFGSGVIIGTAFLHLLSPAFEALRNPCLPDGPIKDYDFAAAITLIAVFVMFTVELLISRVDIFGHSHDTHEKVTFTQKHTPNDLEANLPGNSSQSSGIPNDVNYPPGNQDHLGHFREHEHDEISLGRQMTAIFILEFGVVFHSIFIGLTLAVAGEEFAVLYVVLVFHQTFEGLGLGTRLASVPWPRSKWWLKYLLGLGYAISTPVSIAIGLGVRNTLQPESPNALIINGVFDSISAGILIYTGLVELLAHEFMFNEQMRSAGLKVQLFALFCVAIGTGLMAVLAIWA